MGKMQKFLLIFFSLLLIFVIAEVGYYFYLSTTAKDTRVKNQITPSPRISATPTSQATSAAVLYGKEYLLSLIPKAKQTKEFAFNGIDYLKQLEPQRKCFLTLNCFELENREDLWTSSINTSPTSAIPVNDPFLIRMSLLSKNDLAGISLSGKINQPQDQWWQNIEVIFISVGNDNHRLYIDAKNGSSPEPIKILDKEFDRKLTLLNIFFDKEGKNMLITDENYKVLEFIDVNKASGNKLPLGLFPDQKFYLGYGIAPKSYLGLLEFKIFPL